MTKKTISVRILLLFVLFSILWVSCKKEIITEEPESYYDSGERLKLSNSLVILDDSELTHNGGQSGVLYDTLTNELRIDIPTVEMTLDTGLVLDIDRADDVLLRRITKVEESNGEYILQTSDGYITDVFDKADITFDFSPEYSNQQMQTQNLSGLKSEELSAALTDDNHCIHPNKISMTVGNSDVVLFSVKDGKTLAQTESTKNTNSSKVGFEHQFNTNKTIVSVGAVQLELEDFGFSWYSDLKADYSVDVSLKHADHGHANFNVIASDMDIKAWFDAALVADGELPLVNETDPLLVPVVMHFEFVVGPAPVIMGVEFALDLGVEVSVEGKAKVSTGYTVEYNIPKVTVGAHMSYYTSWFKLHYDSGVDYSYEQGSIVDQYFHPIKLEAMATLKQVYTLKPTMGISIYGLVGPELNLAIGNEFDFSVGGGVSLSASDSEDPQAYVGWGGKLSTKIGAGGGAWIDAMGVLNKHWDIPTLSLLPAISIWKTPESMKDATDSDFAYTVVGEGKEVTVEVDDSWSLPAPMMFVEWVSDGGGHWEQSITMTSLGTTTNKWIPAEEGTFHPYCYVKNGELKEMGRVTFTTATVAQ